MKNNFVFYRAGTDSVFARPNYERGLSDARDLAARMGLDPLAHVGGFSEERPTDTEGQTRYDFNVLISPTLARLAGFA